LGAIWIVDACVFIDMRAAGLLTQMTELSGKLGQDLATTDLVADELNENPDETELSRLGFEIVGFSAGRLDELVCFRSQYSGLSLSDASAFLLALERESMLVTNEGPLRNRAARSGVQVHGTLWLLQQMVRQNVVSPRKAATALKTMLAAGSRFPNNGCAKLLTAWDAVG